MAQTVHTAINLQIILKIVVFWFIYIQNNSDPAHSTVKTALKAICEKMFQFYNHGAV